MLHVLVDSPNIASCSVEKSPKDGMYQVTATFRKGPFVTKTVRNASLEAAVRSLIDDPDTRRASTMPPKM